MIPFEPYFSDVIFEALEKRPEILKKLEEQLKILKQDLSNKQIISQIEDTFKEFTHVKHVQLTIENKWKDSLNASVLGIPFIQKVQTALFSFLDKIKNKGISSEVKMKDMEHDIPFYLERVYLILSPKLFNEFNERQIVAIILHEIGHLYNHDFSIFNYLFNIFVILLNKSLFLGSVISLILHHAISFSAFTISIFLFSRTLTFLEHRSEYNADKYPVKYGYGDDFIEVLKKFEEKKVTSKTNNKWLKKLIAFMTDVFIVSTHPTTSNRIVEVAKIIRKEYCQQYKELEPKIIAMTANYI